MEKEKAVNPSTVNPNPLRVINSADRVLLWNGLQFRSQAEIKIAEALERVGVLFFPNARGRLSSQGSRVNYEPDFLVFNRVGHGILEVDGPQHRWSLEEDRKRDRLFKSYGIRVVERFSHLECWQVPDRVVQQFLFLLKAGYR